MAPVITINGNLQNFVGAVDIGASIRVTLVGFQGQQPRIAGTGFIVGVDVPVSIDGSGNFTFTPWGNDVIFPQNATYYSIAFKPGAGGTVTVVNYRFTGSGVFDLSMLTPLAVPAGIPSPIPPNAVVTNAGGTQVIVGFALQTRLALPHNIVSFSATPIFNAVNGTLFDITLTGNVTSSTLTNTNDGEIVVFSIRQNSTGGFTFAWPANMTGMTSPDPAANSRSVQAAIRIGSQFFPLGDMISN